MVLFFTACSDEASRQPLYPNNKHLTIKMVQGTYDSSGLSVMCVDGVKYLVTEEGGIAPKYQVWRDVDATVEECD